MTESICCFTTVYPHEKNQHHASIHSWNPEDSIMGIVFGVPRCVWLHPYEWTDQTDVLMYA